MCAYERPCDSRAECHAVSLAEGWPACLAIVASHSINKFNTTNVKSFSACTTAGRLNQCIFVQARPKLPIWFT